RLTMALGEQTLEQLQGEPGWLRERREMALENFEKLPAPSKTDEEWRRTDVSRLDPNQFSKLEHLDGQKLILPEALPKGVILKPLRQAAIDHPDLIEPRLFSLVHADRDRFAALHAAFFTGGTFLYVPDGVVIDQPVIGQHFSHEAGTSVLPHTLIVAGKNSKFDYLDEYIAENGDESGYRTGSAEIFLGEGSRVGYVAVQKWGRNVWHFSDERAELQKDATLRLFNVTLGAKFSKNRVEASLAGEGGDAELKAIYFASGEQFFDFHTLQDHRVGKTRSDLLFKGALADTARTVYAGLIRIEKHAARSDAYQANRNLVLSDKAKATSIPMLEIDNNDVRCTHGATVGPVDPEHLFYLRSRGIPEPTAKRMLIQGFFGNVLDRIPFEHARRLVEAELETRIG
ncbi:MAG TPA: Fe-S cluster assembly protein SufD, partial [Candidatus Dormibacteraeota bacterium]|nr:Fe-S cluster assembly protein SufD [Candidatus Dormibacteraeota bacterium]